MSSGQSGKQNLPGVDRGSRIWATIRKLVLCYLGAALAFWVALLVASPRLGMHGIGPGEGLAVSFISFPILPGVIIGLLLEPSGLAACSRHLVNCIARVGFPFIAFVAVFALLWKLVPARVSAKDADKASNSISQLRIERSRGAASEFLLDPAYVMDYAKATGRDLDGIHALIRAGQLSSYWHKGILFVGQRKVDAPDPELQGTRDEVARS